MNQTRTRRLLLQLAGPSTLALAASLSAMNATAATATSTLAVTGSVVANCQITATGMALAGYDPVVTNSASGVDLTGTGGVSVICTLGATTEIILGQGLTPASGSTDAVPLRQLHSTTATSPSNVLAYFLYQSTGTTVPWTNSLSTGFYPYTGTGNTDALTIYAVVPKGQAVQSASDYADSVVATINF